MIDCFDSDDWLFIPRAQGATGIIAGPFPERPLRPGIFGRWRHFAFDGNFRGRRNRQTSEGPAQNLERFTDKAAGNFQLRTAVWKFCIRRHENQRMLTVTRHHWAALALFPIFHANLPAVLSGAHPEAQGALIVKLHPVCAGVDEAAIGVTVDQPAARTEVTTAVVFMET